MESKIIKLYEGDPVSGAVAEAVKDVIYERCVGMGMVHILGILEAVKIDILREQD